MHDPSLARNSTAELLRKRLREVEEPIDAAARGLGAAAHHHNVLLDGLAAAGAGENCWTEARMVLCPRCRLTHPMEGVCVCSLRVIPDVVSYVVQVL